MTTSNKKNFLTTRVIALVCVTVLALTALIGYNAHRRAQPIPMTPLPTAVELAEAKLNHFMAKAISDKNRLYAQDMEDGKNAAFATDQTLFWNEVLIQYYPGERTFYLERDVGLEALKDPHLRQGRQYRWAAYANTLDILVPSNKYDVKAGKCYPDKCFLIVTIPSDLPIK